MAQIAVTQLLAPIAEIVRQCPTSTLIRNYVAAVREFCDHTRWLRCNVSGVTVADQPQYSLGSDPHNEIFGIRAMAVRTDSSDAWTSVTESASGLWDPNASTDRPRNYQYIPHGQFKLNSTPDAAYQLAVTVVMKPKRGATSIDDSLIVEWDEAFKAGALYRLLRIPEEPWTNPAESTAQYTLFTGFKHQGASAAAVGYNAGAASTTRPGGPNAAPRSRVLPI